jgi:hypothetical protein
MSLSKFLILPVLATEVEGVKFSFGSSLTSFGKSVTGVNQSIFKRGQKVWTETPRICQIRLHLKRALRR